jgi:putative transposase
VSRSHHYPSDLSDAERLILAPLLPPAPIGDRHRKWPLRTILDGIFYILRGGCAWRLLPCDFPPWQTVYHYFRRWRRDGIWERLNATLREREWIRQGRNAQPSACVINSQSVKATSVGGTRGYDRAKKLSGRKRHLVAEVPGLVLRARVLAADAQDRAAVPPVLGEIAAQFPHPEHVWVDQGYTRAGKEWIEQHLRWTVEIVRHTPNPRGEWRPIGDFNDSATLRFEWVRLPAAPKRLRGVLPRRWVAEMGTLWAGFSWFGQSRRLAKEYERLCATSEAMIYATMTRLMARRLACA